MAERSAFFYGTLMAPSILYRVIFGTSNAHPSLTSTLTISPAILHGYCRHKVLGADYPAIIAEAGQNVRGTYVTGLTAQNVYRLDQFEGDQYAREKVHVEVLDGPHAGQKVEAETYVFLDKEDLEKGEWDFEIFKREKMYAWEDSSAEYDDIDAISNPPGVNETGDLEEKKL